MELQEVLEGDGFEKVRIGGWKIQLMAHWG